MKNRESVVWMVIFGSLIIYKTPDNSATLNLSG
jgi:hypothetical protein